RFGGEVHDISGEAGAGAIEVVVVASGEDEWIFAGRDGAAVGEDDVNASEDLVASVVAVAGLCDEAVVEDIEAGILGVDLEDHAGAAEAAAVPFALDIDGTACDIGALGEAAGGAGARGELVVSGEADAQGLGAAVLAGEVGDGVPVAAEQVVEASGEGDVGLVGLVEIEVGGADAIGEGELAAEVLPGVVLKLDALGVSLGEEGGGV